MLNEVSVKNVKIQDSFWSPKQALVKDVVIPYQEKVLDDQIPGIEKSHALANFRIAAGMEGGEFYGMVFQDSDVAKWLEGVAYSLMVMPDKVLEKRADEIIALIEKAQESDGYLNTYFTVKEPEHKWQNLLECHELYCTGHMMEAAAAYYEATGKDRLLQVMEKMADHIIRIFGSDKREGIPGHQEIEIGLMRLYHASGKDKYLSLAQYFIEERGKNPAFFKEEAARKDWIYFGIDPSNTKYNQSHLPVREQKTAEGHCVRAVYMYTAMAAIARQTRDKELFDACDTLWNNITQKRMYLTGGIGSTAAEEGFTIDYDLPNDTIYAETCASIALVFFAKEMLNIRPNRKYGDVMELALYNGILSGMQLDGKRFFYVNPLEVNPGVSGVIHGYKHVLPERPPWYACACCPPNVVRMLMALGKYAWGYGENVIYSHLFIGGEAHFPLADIQVESSYPWEGKVTYTIHPQKEKEPFVMAVRIPEYIGNTYTLKVLEGNGNEAKELKLSQKAGYLYLERNWADEDKMIFTFDMPVRRIRCHTAVRSNIGRVALMRGPIVYCFEGADNGEYLQELRIPENAKIKAVSAGAVFPEDMMVLELTGKRLWSRNNLYTEKRLHSQDVEMKAIPYFAWGNRGVNQMSVWMMECYGD